MNRLRTLGSLLLALFVGGALFALCYWTAERARVAVARHETNELAWLCREFRLTDSEVARIRTLHDGYKPKCEEMCARVAAKNAELAALLKGATNVTAEVEHKLAEIAGIRAECQAQMLRHFQEVARTMPANQGARYLDEMQRLTLGVHLSSEEAASPSAHHEHP